MPSNKSALLRYKIIDRRIRNKYKPFPGVEDLDRHVKMNCSIVPVNMFPDRLLKKTFVRCGRMKCWGYLAPIKFDKMNGGYYYENADYSISVLPLNDEELRAILLRFPNFASV